MIIGDIMLISPDDIEEIKKFLMSMVDKYEFDKQDEETFKNVISGLDFVGETVKLYLVLVSTLYSFGNAVNLANSQYKRN